MSSVIRSKLSAVRTRHKTLSLATGIAAGLASLLIALAITMFFDWLLNLSYLTRAIMLAINLGLVGWWVWKHTISPIMFGPDEEDAALWIERAYPEFQSRLISSIQLVRPGVLASAGASPLLVAALVRETESMASRVQNPRVVNGDRCTKLSGLATASLVVFIAGFVLISHVATPLLLRAFLVPNVPVPRKTRVVLQHPPEVFVARGDDLVIRAQAVGIVPDNGRIKLRFRGGDQSYSMEPEAEDRSIFARKIENVQDSFTYVAKLYDGESEEAKVTVVARPTVVSIECIQHWPAYTGVAAAPRQVGDLALLAGSRLQLKIKASQDLKRTLEHDKARNVIRLSGGDTEAMLMAGADSRELITDEKGIELPDGTVGFSVSLVDSHGVVSKDPVVYRIDLIPDMPPKVKVTNPLKKEVTLTQRGFERVGFEAADDLAVGKIRIRYAVIPPSATAAPTDPAATQPTGPEGIVIDPNDPSVRTMQEFDPQKEGLSPKAPRGHYAWYMDKIEPRPAIGTVIQWWLEAEDLNNLRPRPVKGLSQRYQFRIVSDLDKMKELMEAAGETSTLVNPLKESQKEAQQRLGPLIKGESKP